MILVKNHIQLKDTNTRDLGDTTLKKTYHPQLTAQTC